MDQSLGDLVVQGLTHPANYEAWYHTPRGEWIGRQECAVLQDFLPSFTNASLLDIGSGTGYFSRFFAKQGFIVTGVEPDRSMRDYARQLDDSISYIDAKVETLPFTNNSYDFVSAVTSLCFVQPPATALAEMWRVCRYGVVLGLLNRHSLLFLRKAGRVSYAGARWGTTRDIRKWAQRLSPMPIELKMRTNIIFSGGSASARFFE